MNIYNDNEHHIIKLDKCSNRMEPSLFNSRASILDGNWKPRECNIREVFYARSSGDRRVGYQKSRKLQLSVAAIVNSFEFITCYGLGQLFGVDATTAYRAVRVIPHVHHKGKIALSTMHGIVAVFHVLVKNMYAMHRSKKGSYHGEEFHFLRGDQASSLLLESNRRDQKRFIEIMEGRQLPSRTMEMLAAEDKAMRRRWKIFWIGAIPFIKNPSKLDIEKSRIIKFCEVTGVPVGNYKKDESIYGSLMRVNLISPMFPTRRDRDEHNHIGIKSISELAFTKN